MTLEEIKSKITFGQRPGQYGIQVRHAANINITVDIGVDSHHPPPIAVIKQRLTDEILHRLYANRQREFAELLEQHALANPMTNEFHDTRHKLISMARRMMPKETND